MGAPYSQDLRERVISVVDGGMRAYQAAPLLRVSVFCIYKALGGGGRQVRRQLARRDANRLQSWRLTMRRCASGSRTSRTPHWRRYGDGCWLSTT